MSASFATQSGNSLATIYPRTIAQPAFVSGNDRREYPFSATTVALDSDFNAAKTKIQNQVGVSAYHYGIWLRGTSPLVAGKTLRATIKAQTIAAVGGVNHGAWFVVLFNDSGYLTELLQGSSFQIAPAAMTAYTYDFNLSALLSSYPAAKYIRVGILCNRASGLDELQTGSRTDFEAFYLDDATESAAAASSANIATTQAAVATAAGSTATTQANLSATYAGQAAGSASTAGTQATNAASSAATATAQAAAATTSQTLTATLVGQSGGLLGPNTNFADWPSGQGLPTTWSTGEGVGAQNTKVTNNEGGFALRIFNTEGQTNQYAHRLRAQQEPFLEGSNYYVMEADLKLVSGNFNASGLHFQFFDINGNYAGDASAALALLYGNGVAGQTYRIRKLVQVPAAARSYHTFCMTRWLGFGTNGTATTIDWFKAGLRQATASEIRDQTVLSPLQATVSTQATAIATLNTRTATYLNRVTAGAGQAEVELIATDSNGNATSNVNIRAAKITLGGQTTPVLTIADGNATFGSDVYVNNAKIVVDTGTHMKVIGKGFGTNGQFIEWFGLKMPFASCSEQNAITFIKTNGNAYFGGSLSVGTLRNAVQTTSLSANANVTTGVFGSNGGPRIVSASYTFSSQAQISGACPTPPSSPYATVQLFRGTNESGTLLATMSVTSGSWNCTPGFGVYEPGRWQFTASQSITVTDNTGGLTASYFVRLINGISGPVGDTTTQSLALASNEG